MVGTQASRVGLTMAVLSFGFLSFAGKNIMHPCNYPMNGPHSDRVSVSRCEEIMRDVGNSADGDDTDNVDEMVFQFSVAARKEGGLTFALFLVALYTSFLKFKHQHTGLLTIAVAATANLLVDGSTAGLFPRFGAHFMTAPFASYEMGHTLVGLWMVMAVTCWVAFAQLAHRDIIRFQKHRMMTALREIAAKKHLEATKAAEKKPSKEGWMVVEEKEKKLQ